jgi:hypothetical protein
MMVYDIINIKKTNNYRSPEQTQNKPRNMTLEIQVLSEWVIVV